MQVPYNFQQVINNNQYQVISGVKCFPVSMLDENFSYLCKVVNVGSTAPTISYDGQFWFDGTTLKIAQSSSWVDIKVANAVNADKFGGYDGTYYLNRANHTGTQAPSTISPQGDGSWLNSDMVDGYHFEDLLFLSMFFGG